MSPRLRRLATSAWVLAMAVGFGWLLASRWETVIGLLDDVRPLGLVVALGASVLTLLPQAWFWHRSLRAFGEPSRFAEVFVATCRALLTRYAPGGVWFAAGRAALLSRRGLGLPALAATGTVELAMSVSVALALGSALLGVREDLPTWSRWVGPVLLVALLAATPWLNRLMAWLADRRGTHLPRAMSRGTMVGLMAVNAGYWLLIGAVFCVYARSFGLDVALLPTQGAFMVSWGVGFLSPFAPQGLGVFEVLLAALLDGRFADLVAVVAGFRALLLVRDVAVWGVAEVVARSGGEEGVERNGRR